MRAWLRRMCFAGPGAKLLPAGEVPAVGEVAALLRLDGLDAALAVFKHDAGAVFGVGEREPSAVMPQLAVALDEVLFVKPEVGRDGADFSLADLDVSLPPAAGAAALAAVDDGGVRRIVCHEDGVELARG